MIELLKKISKENIVTVINSDSWKIVNSFRKKKLELVINSFSLNQQLKKVEELIYESTCDNSWMGECSRYHLKSGGKRFRAALALVSGQEFNLDERQRISEEGGYYPRPND